MHVAASRATRAPASPRRRRGTYAGLIEKIPYLQELGITAVELLPVFQFDAQDCPPGMVNYWGYQPVSFFAPHQAYSSRQDPLGPVDEFRDMVKALHRAGIEVILDVVFNHTAEGDARRADALLPRARQPDLLHPRGRPLALRRLQRLRQHAQRQPPDRPPDDRRQPPLLGQEMHVDGFRFDLASILARDASGHPMPNPPVLWDIETDPALAGTKLIAEAWDAAGLYQVGSFVGDSWKEWNGRFRDDVRDFFRGDPGSLRRFADRLVGSPEIYGHKQREAEQSVNFVTCHDGFTLNDLVSYNDKHNEANGEDNRDGANDNLSWNCGVEGPTDDPAIEGLRNRQVKNFLTVTLLSLGVPMILMGDEVRRTQRGNNNAYCHDDETSWFDWTLLEQARGRAPLRARCSTRGACCATPSTSAQRVSLTELIQRANKAWHGVKLDQPDWGDHSHSIAFTRRAAGRGPARAPDPERLLGAARVRAAGGGRRRRESWRRWIDTSLDVAGRHRPVGGGARPCRPCLSGGRSLRRSAVRRSSPSASRGTGQGLTAGGAEPRRRKACLSMPRRRMRDSSVLGGTPSASAAPPSP